MSIVVEQERANNEWMKNASAHELYYPSGIQASHESRSSIPCICAFTEIKGLPLSAPVILIKMR